MTTVQIVVAIITGIAAFTGAVLGIINTIHRIQQAGVRLQVTPKLIKAACDWAAVNIGVKVINFSSFPVTIVDVGLVFKNRKRENESIVHYIRHESDPEPDIPVTLAPKEMKIWVHPLGPWDALDSIIFDSIKCAYVDNEFGNRICGIKQEFRNRCRRFKRLSSAENKTLPHLSQPEG